MSGHEIVIGAIGIIATIFSMIYIAWGRVRQVNVPVVAVWSTRRPPRVWLGVPTGPGGEPKKGSYPGQGLDRKEVERAMKWWQDLGYDIDFGSSPTQSSILVYVDDRIDTRSSYDDTAKQHGLTELIWDNNPDLPVDADGHPKYIATAYCRMTNNPSALIIAHELGHALGFDHVPNGPAGLMMNADPDRIGWSDRGLRKA